MFDLFQACLASCQHKDLSVALYANQSTRFTCRARWWACPTGDPNAGKSPTCSAISNLFSALVSQHRPLFHPVDHFVGVGNNGKIQERLRRLEGALLLWGPEAKPILDPNFPNRETVDIGKYLDLTRWLECANGGKFEWGTGAEEKQVLKADGDPYVALVFPSTNVNLCLYQQFNLFKNWWVKVEHKHQCGFAARVLMTPTTRAIVDIDTGLLDARLMDSFFSESLAGNCHALGATGPSGIFAVHFCFCAACCAEILRWVAWIDGSRFLGVCGFCVFREDGIPCAKRCIIVLLPGLGSFWKQAYRAAGQRSKMWNQAFWLACGAWLQYQYIDPGKPAAEVSQE